MLSTSSAVAAVVTQHNAAAQTSIPRRRPTLRCTQQPGTPNQIDLQEQVYVSILPQEDMSASSEGRPAASIPAIIVTSPGSTPKKPATGQHDVSVPASSLRGINGVLVLQDSRDDSEILPPAPPSAFSMTLQCADTQDTVDSTQQSDVFSPPADFAQFTPPSQEGTQDVELSQAIYPHATRFDTASDADMKGPQRSSRRPSSDMSQLEPFAPALGKRPRTEKEMAEGRVKTKRSKASI